MFTLSFVVTNTHGLRYARNVGRVFSSPYNSPTVLAVGFAVDANALLPFRVVAELSSTVSVMQAAVSLSQASQSSTQAALLSTQSSTQAAMSSAEAALVTTQAVMALMIDDALSSQVSQSSTQATLQATHASLVSTQAMMSLIQADLVSTQAELVTVGGSVCNQPACAAGAHAVDGACVPNCPDTQR
jgi:hypothetical protein